jgi:drug/metabolite transporter (DMT)-like permease
MASSAFFTSLIEPIYLKKKINPIEILLGVVVIFGIFQIFYSPVNEELMKQYTFGILLGVLAAFLSSLVTVLSKKLSNKYNGYTLTFYQIFTGFIILSFFVPFHIYQKGFQGWIPTLEDWIYLLIMGIICTVIACTLALNSLQHLSSYTMTLNINLEPVYGIILAFLIFKENEHFTYRFYIGAGVILTALMLHALYLTQKRV